MKTVHVTINENNLRNHLRDTLRSRVSEYINSGNIEHINKSKKGSGWLIPSEWNTGNGTQRRTWLTEGKAAMNFDMATGILNITLDSEVVEI